MERNVAQLGTRDGPFRSYVLRNGCTAGHVPKRRVAALPRRGPESREHGPRPAASRACAAVTTIADAAVGPSAKGSLRQISATCVISLKREMCFVLNKRSFLFTGTSFQTRGLRGKRWGPSGPGERLGEGQSRAPGRGRGPGASPVLLAALGYLN